MKKTPFIRPVFLSVLAMLLVGCGQQTQQAKSGLPTVEMKIGSKSFELEVAEDDYSRMHGLMERDSMPEAHGMIFVFSEDTTEPFWMHNTRIPLDILFVEASGKVLSVKQMKPFDDTTTPSGGPYRYAIELNAGSAAGCGVKAGDMVVVPFERYVSSVTAESRATGGREK